LRPTGTERPCTLHFLHRIHMFLLCGGFSAIAFPP
jgi:hypothetical protein